MAIGFCTTCGHVRTLKSILEASESLDGFQQERNTVMFLQGRTLLCVCGGAKRSRGSWQGPLKVTELGAWTRVEAVQVERSR